METNPAYSEDLTTKAKPGKSAVCTYFKFRPGVLVTAAGDFPNISLAKSGWRTDTTLNGSFASGTWTFKVRLENDTKYAFSVKVAIRLSRSVNADGSGATLIIVSESPNVLALPAAAGGSVSDTWTWSAPALTLTNEYLFAEFRIHIQVAGTSTTCQCSFACDEDPAVADESITTTTFTPPPPPFPTITETVAVNEFPMPYLSKPTKAQQLISKVEGAPTSELSKGFPRMYLKKGKVAELQSKFHPLYEFSDGFESGDFSKWTGTLGSPTVVTDPVKSGTYAMRVFQNIPSMPNGAGAGVYKTFADLSEVMLEFYVRFAALPVDYEGFLFYRVLNDLGGSLSDYTIVQEGTLYHMGGTTYEWEFDHYYDGQKRGPAYCRFTSPQAEANVWYKIKTRYKKTITGSDGVFQVWIDDVEKVTKGDLNTNTVMRRFNLEGGYNGFATKTLYYDDASLKGVLA